MQLGFQSSGTKAEVLADISFKVAKDLKKHADKCSGNQYPVYDSTGNIVKHNPAPIADTTFGPLASAALAAVIEHLSHVKDDAPVAVSFQLTIHRENPGA